MINNKEEFKLFIDESGSFINGKRICKDCGMDFEISSHEVSHFYNYDQSLPKRCKICRGKRRA